MQSRDKRSHEGGKTQGDGEGRQGEKVGEVLLINSIYSLSREREREGERFVLSVIEMERG